MTNAALSFVRHLRATPAQPPQTVDDEFGRAILRRAEQRGIIPRGVLEQDEEPWNKRVLRVLAEDRDWQERHESDKARREAEEAETQLTPAQRLAIAIGGHGGGHMPLNGSGVLRAALAGAAGTINGA